MNSFVFSTMPQDVVWNNRELGKKNLDIFSHIFGYFLSPSRLPFSVTQSRAYTQALKNGDKHTHGDLESGFGHLLSF